MPWTPEQFAARHNKRLSGGKAAQAAKVANAILAKTGDEGKAIRIANAEANGTIHRKFGLDSVGGKRGQA